MHSGAIVRELQGQSSSVHSVLKRMHERGLIEPHFIEETGSRSGLRPGEKRKVWDIGPVGHVALEFYNALNEHMGTGEAQVAPKAVQGGAAALPSTEAPPEPAQPEQPEAPPVPPQLGAPEGVVPNGVAHGDALASTSAPLGALFSDHPGLER